MTLEQACQAAIEKYAPPFRQINAALSGEHREYIDVVLTLYRNHYQLLKQDGAEWCDLPQQALDYLTERKPY